MSFETLFLKYFPDLTIQQQDQLLQLPALYQSWNQKINVISRKDINNIVLHHILHSLAIAKFFSFRSGSKILDLGTGGGFPGIPLAVAYPQSTFTLIDGTLKKIKVVREIASSIALENVVAIHQRAEEHHMQYDFVVTRAVASIKKLLTWTDGNILSKHHNLRPNGIIALKGKNIVDEIAVLDFELDYEIIELNTIFEESFFDSKCILYIKQW